MVRCDCGNDTHKRPCVMCVMQDKGKFIVKLDLSKMPKTMEALNVTASSTNLTPRDVLGELVQREFQKREEGI